jgi:Ribonuclease G/E
MGQVKSLESMVLKALRDVRAFARREDGARVELSVPEAVAAALVNSKRAALLELERQFNRDIVVTGDPHLHPEEVRIRTV